MYKHVYEYRDSTNGVSLWQAQMKNPKTGSSNGKYYKTEKEAAKAVDMFLINAGFEPLNVLKKA